MPVIVVARPAAVTATVRKPAPTTVETRAALRMVWLALLAEDGRGLLAEDDKGLLAGEVR